MRGEYRQRTHRPDSVLGSPPLARGILNCHLQIFLINGITPACAGNTWQGDKVQPTTKDHPRLRGEYIKRGKIFSDGLGSPPLARGIPWCQIRRHFMTGITPACAGNTRFITKIRRVAWDHPRLRGEYGKVLLVRQLSIGSPPLARGIQHILWKFMKVTGITPACAGNTEKLSTVYNLYWDHPRLRGEYEPYTGRWILHQGSPPLARGIPVSAVRC